MILTGFVLCFIFLAVAIKMDIFLGVPLIACIVVFSIIALIEKKKIKEIAFMLWSGTKKSFGILKIFILLGAIGSTWIYSGTLPAMVYYCLKYITPQLFILFCFVGCAVVSYLNGSSFGTVGTIGVALITLAKATNLPLAIISGAIISGAYYGDRGAPVSSAAVLVAGITSTNHMENVKNMHKSAGLPLILTIVFFGILSFFNPLPHNDSQMMVNIAEEFKISIIVLIPAILMFILPLLKIDVIISMGASVISALIISVALQIAPLAVVLKSMIFGCSSVGALEGTFNSGGIIAFLITYIMVGLSCGLAGLFNGLNVFGKIKGTIKKYINSGKKRMEVTSLVSIFTCAYGCNQTIASILTCEIMGDSYQNDNKQLALDIENSTLTIAGLIPWCVASFVPTGILEVSKVAYIPFAFYLYAVPICTILFYDKIGRVKE